MSTPETDAVRDRKKGEAHYLAFGFYVVSGLISLDLIIRNVGPWQVSYRALWGFYVVWELASILFTIVITVFYWRKYISRGDKTAYADLLPSDNKKFHVFGLILLSAVSLIIAGLVAVYIALNGRSQKFPVDELLVVEALCLTLGVFLVVIAEIMIIKAAPLAKARVTEDITRKEALLSTQTDQSSKDMIQQELEALKKKRADYDDISDDIAKALSFSDVPIGAAFFGILALVLAHEFGWTGADSYLLPPFIAGAVALQLLYSNFVFYVEANGAFPKWVRTAFPTLNNLTPMIQGHRNRSTSSDV